MAREASPTSLYHPRNLSAQNLYHAKPCNQFCTDPMTFLNNSPLHAKHREQFCTNPITFLNSSPYHAKHCKLFCTEPLSHAKHLHQLCTDSPSILSASILLLFLLPQVPLACFDRRPEADQPQQKHHRKGADPRIGAVCQLAHSRHQRRAHKGRAFAADVV